MLEKISGYTAEQAKSYLLSQLENELAHEKPITIVSSVFSASFLNGRHPVITAT